MQQPCSKCGAPIMPGNVVCTNCGTPVSSGGGSYDPTIRASAPPGTNYGPSNYGAPPPSVDPYAAQYSAPPASPYGAPPPPPAFGVPQAPIFTPIATKPVNTRKRLFISIGIIAVVLVVIVLVAPVLFKFKQVVTTGTHITSIQVGTGLDQTSEAIQGATDTFSNNTTVYISFTVVTQDDNATVTLKLFFNGSQESSDSVTPQAGTTQYGNSVLVHNTGEHKFEVDYNGTAEATITFNVT